MASRSKLPYHASVGLIGTVIVLASRTHNPLHDEAMRSSNHTDRSPAQQIDDPARMLALL